MAQDGAAETAEFARAHARLLADDDIQFDLAVEDPIEEPPEWLKALVRWLGDYSWLLEYLFWGFVGLLVLGLLAFIVMRLTGMDWPWRRKRTDGEEAEEWRPAEAPARALLREADALAAEGRFSEAAHLLLFRSIEEIESRRPKLVRPALTSRDIAGASALPDRPKRAFATIVHHVELSLFGGRILAEPDWRQCRAAYEEFAFAKAWKG